MSLFEYNITGRPTADDILTIMLISGRTNRQTLYSIGTSQEYIERTIRELRDKDKLIKEDKGVLWVNNRRIKEVAPKQLYEYFYNTASYEGTPGRTKLHVERSIRTSQVILLAKRAAISVGPENKKYEDIQTGIEDKYNASKKTLYLNKEIKSECTQSQARQRITRTYGVIATPPINCTVLNVGKSDVLISSAIEKEANIRMTATIRDLYEESKTLLKISGHSLIVCETENDLIELAQKGMAAYGTNKGAAKNCLVSEAMANTKLTHAEYHIVSLSDEGVNSMKLMTSMQKSEMINMSFSEDERKRAASEVPFKGPCDGITSSGLHCVEFLTSNITKLIYARNCYKELGIACAEHQLKTLKEIIGGKENGIRFRCFDDESVTKKMRRSVEKNYG